MSVPVAIERRMLTEAEFEAVERSHYPQLCGLSRDELIGVAKRLREYRDKARDVSRQQRREMRGKAEARGSRPAADNTGTSRKKQVFSSALKRVNCEIERSRRSDAGRQSEQRLRRHPSAGAPA